MTNDARNTMQQILGGGSAVAVLERATTVEEFLAHVADAGDLAVAEARRVVEEAFAAEHGHRLSVEELVAPPRLEDELRELDRELTVAPSPANLLAGAIDAAFPPNCWTSSPRKTWAC